MGIGGRKRTWVRRYIGGAVLKASIGGTRTPHHQAVCRAALGPLEKAAASELGKAAAAAVIALIV